MIPPISEQTLPNGLKILCLKKSSAPVVSVQLWYRTGSVNEQDGIRGISHFFEHMMFRGSAHFGSEEHARRINDVGGHCNAFTAEDMTAYTNSVPRTALDMVLELEADRMQNLIINQQTLDTERKVIVEEYHTHMNNPVAKAFLEFRREFYGTHPYAISPLGRLEDIESITVDDCQKYYQKWYSPSNAVLIVVGDFESPHQVFERVLHYFGAIDKADTGSSQQSPLEGDAVVGEHTSPRFTKKRVEFDVPLVLCGYPAPPTSSPDALKLEILQQIVSQGDTGRLHANIVRKRSLAVMAGGMNHLLKRSGMSMFFAAFTPDMSVRRVMAAIDEQLQRVCDEGISAIEFDKVRNATLANRIFELYSSEQICQRLGYAEVVEGDYRDWVDRMDALERLTIDELTEVARRWWVPSRKRTLYLKPRKAKPLLYLMGLMRRMVPGKG
jgi:zinc protease